MDTTINDLNKLLAEAGVCPSHGIEHAIQVMEHAKNALNAFEYSITETEFDAVLAAALLHDADDRKFFPANDNYQNLRQLLTNANRSPDFIELAVRMVKLVSASANGDNIPEDITDKLWMLIPRYADRLEAIGEIGIKRCIKYNKTIQAPDFLPTTPRPQTEEDIVQLSMERYAAYGGHSQSMIDHFFDKLVAITVFPISNPYFDEETKTRRQPILDYVKYFCEHGKLMSG